MCITQFTVLLNYNIIINFARYTTTDLQICNYHRVADFPERFRQLRYPQTSSQGGCKNKDMNEAE